MSHEDGTTLASRGSAHLIKIMFGVYGLQDFDIIQRIKDSSIGKSYIVVVEILLFICILHP